MKIMNITIVLILSIFFSIGVFGTPVSEERFNDFYKRKKELEQENQAREKGQKKIAEDRKAEELEYQRKASDYVKTRKALNQDKVDEDAEKWMEEQNRLHDAALDQARQKYISSQKSNNKFVIPEVEEFEVK